MDRVTGMRFAAIAGKRGHSTALNRRRLIYHRIGPMQGGALNLASTLASIFPDWFSMICYVSGIIYFVTGGTRIAAATANFR